MNSKGAKSNFSVSDWGGAVYHVTTDPPLLAVDTKLLDQEGRPIFREPQRIGFVRQAPGYFVRNA